MTIKRRQTSKSPGAGERETRVLAEIERAIEDRENMVDFYRRVEAAIRSFIPAEQVVVAFLDPVTNAVKQEFVSPASEEAPGTDATDPWVSHDVVERLRATLRPVQIDELKDSAKTLPGLTHIANQQIASAVFAPLVDGSAFHGLLGVTSFEPGVYADADTELLGRIADGITGPVALARVQRLSARESREREILDDISRAANSTRDINSTLDEAIEKLKELLPVDRVSVSVRSSASDSLDMAYACGVEVGPAENPRSLPSSDDGIRELVARSGVARVVDDIDDALIAEAPGAVRMKEAGLRSAIFVPMRTDGETIGVLSVYCRVKHAYSDRDVALIGKMAVQITGAFAFAELSAAVEVLNHQQALIEDLVRRVDASIGLEEVYAGLGDVIPQLVPCDRFTVVMRDDGHDSDTFVERLVWGKDLSGYEGEPLPMSGSITEHVVRTGETVVWPSPDWPDDRIDLFPVTNAARRSGLTTFVSSPLMVASECVGVAHFDGLGSWEPVDRDIAMAGVVSSHIGGALSRLHLIDRLDQMARDEALLAEIGRVVSSKSDVAGVYGSVADLLSTAIRFDGISIASVDTDGGKLRVDFVDGGVVPGFDLGDEWRLHGTHTGRVIEDGSPANLTGAGLQETATDFPALGEFLTANNIQSRLVVPIFNSEAPVGAITLHARRPEAFSARDLEITRRVGDQISGAMANAALRAQLERSAAVEAGLAKIGRVVTASHDFADVFDSVVDSMASLIEFDRLTLATIDDSERVLETRFAYGIDMDGFEPGDRQVLSTEVIDQLRDLKDGGVIAEFSEGSSELMGHAQDAAIRAGLPSAMLVTLRNHGDLIGNMSIRSSRRHVYGPQDLEIFRRIAAQVAGALANSDLHAQVERRAREEELLAEISRIVTSSADFGEVYEAVAGTIGRLISFDRMAMATIDVATKSATTRFVTGIELTGFQPGNTIDFSDQLDSEGRTVDDVEIFDSAQEMERGRENTEEVAVAAGLRWGMSVNLRSQGILVGNLSLRSTSEDPYSENELALLKKIGAQISGAFANSALHEKSDRAALEESVLAKISRDVGAMFEPEMVLNRILADLTPIIPTERATIALADSDSGTLEFAFVAGARVETGSGVDKISPSPGGLPALVAKSGRTMQIHDALKSSVEIPGSQNLAASGLRSAIGVPMMWDGQLIGVFGVSTGDPNAYSPHHVNLAERVSAQLAGWVVNARLHRDLEHQALIERVLAEIARDAASSLDMDEGLNNLVGRLSELMPSDRAIVAVGDAGGLRPVYATSLHQNHHANSEYARSDGFISHVGRTGETLRVDDLGQLIDRFPGAQTLHDEGIRSVIAVPMLWESEVVGVIGVGAHRTAAYDPSDVAVVERTAQILAGVAVNSDLHRRVEAQAIEQRTLAEIGRVVNSSVQPVETFGKLTKLIQSLIRVQRVVIATWDQDRTSVLQTVAGEGPVVPTRGTGEEIPFAESVTEFVLNTGETYVWSDSGDRSDQLPGLAPLVEQGLRSAISVPLISVDRAVGVLHLSEFDGVGFTDRDVHLAESIAAQIAGAVANADLFLKAAQQARERLALTEIGKLAGSSLDAATLFQRLAPTLRNLVPFDRMTVSTYEADDDTWFTHFTEGDSLPGVASGDIQKSTTSASRHILDSRSSILMSDPGDHGGRFHDERAREAGLNSLVLTPMLDAELVIGAIAVHSREAGTYKAHHVQLLEQVAAQISGAFQNASLHSRVEQQARDQKLLAEIGRVVNSAAYLDDAFDGFSHLVKELVPSERIVFAKVVSGSDTMLVRSAGNVDRHGRANTDKFSIPKEGSLSGHVLASGKTFTWSSARSPKDLSEAFPVAKPTIEAGLTSLISVPLMILERPVGVLHLENFQRSAHTERDVALAEAVGVQIAGAFANADLLDQTEREATERAVLAEIGRLISSSLDLSDIYARIADQVAELITFDRMSIVNVDQGTDSLTSLFATGPEVRGWIPDIVQPLSGTVAADVASSREPVLVNTASADEFIELYPAQKPVLEVTRPCSLIAVPLARAGEVFGVMHLSSETPGAYVPTDVDTAVRVGEQISGGIVNADLFARMEEHATERSQLAEVGRLVGSTLDLSQLWPRLIRPIQSLVNYDRLAVVLIDNKSRRRWTEFWDGVDFAGSRVDDPWREGSPASKALGAGRSILISDVDDPNADRSLMGQDEIEAGFRSKVGVPIMFNAEVVGELDIKAFRPHSYSPLQLDRLEQLASLLAGPIANSQLHATVVMRAVEEEIISEIGRDVSSSLNFGSIFGDLATAVKRLIPYDRFVIQGVDYETLQVWTHYVDGVAIAGRDAGTSRTMDGMTDPGILTEPVLVTASPGDEAYNAGLKEMIAAPLVWEGRVVGNLSARSKFEGELNQHHLDLLVRVAQQVTGAFVNSELHSITAREAEERAVLAEIGRLVSRSLDVDEMFGELAEPIRRLIPYDRLAFSTDNPEEATWVNRFVIGVPVPGYEVGIVHKSTTLPLLADANDGDGENQATEDMRLANLRSGIFVPLVFAGTSVGLISVKSLEDNAYSQRHVETFRRIAAQIAGNVASAQMHEVTEREASERAVLAEIGRLVSRSLDFEDIFDPLADALKRLVPYDRFAIMGVDPDERKLWTHYAAGVQVEGWEAGTVHDLADWQVGDQLMPVEGVLVDSSKLDDENEMVMRRAGFEVSASVPLIWEDRAFGALSVRSKTQGQFTRHHLDLLGQVAQQVVGAFVNAELYETTVREARERAQLSEIGRLVGVSLDIREMFEAILEPVRELIPFDRLGISTFDEESGMWTPRFVSGVGIEGFEEGTQSPADTPFTRSITDDYKSVILTGEEGENGQTVPHQSELPSAMYIPLVANQGMIGVISFRSRKKRAYLKRHELIGRNLADQIAGNVASSELHRALADNEAQTRAVVETATVGIVTADATLSMLTVNDALLEIFGYEREELIGKNVKVLAAEPYRGEHDRYLSRYNQTGEPHIIGTYREVEGRRKDGSTFPIELEVTRVDLERGRMYTAVIRDITDRKLAEAELAEMAATLEERVEQRTEQLQQANSELEAFSYTVSHDLRGPLSMNAHLASRLLESSDDRLSETSRKYIELIARSSTESAALVTDLLNFARLGQQSMELKPVELDGLAESIQQEFAELHPNVLWKMDHLPGCDADQGLLRAVFTNLFSNACKFTASREQPTVEIGATRSDDETVYYVKDNGIGFDMSQEHRVFEVFERLHRPEDYEGTGTGLAIVRRIVERHGGRIWVESEPNVGTTFYFTLAHA